METDYLQCSDNLYGSAWHDAVIYNYGGEMRFAELEMAFVVTLGPEDIPFCLVCPYGVIDINCCTTKDKELQLL
jgi:hypothetical protein